MSRTDKILTYIAVINTLTLIGVAITQVLSVVELHRAVDLLRQIAGVP